jgi:hypothetical protein
MTKRLAIVLSVLACLVYFGIPRVTHIGTNARTTFEQVARELGDDDAPPKVSIEVLNDGC